MTVNYCHNCRYHRPLPDTVYCEWCKKFFYIEGRLPCPADKLGPTWADVAVDITERHLESMRVSRETSRGR